jgi:periplasmic divalent cation tolerance protein
MVNETPDVVLLYVTTADVAEAGRIGRTLVEERLAACANVLPGMTSVYEWQGKLCESQEAVLVLKTRASLVDEATAKVCALHSYECPCVVALPIIGGNPDFTSWIRAQSGPR